MVVPITTSRVLRYFRQFLMRFHLTQHHLVLYWLAPFGFTRIAMKHRPNNANSAADKTSLNP